MPAGLLASRPASQQYGFVSCVVAVYSEAGGVGKTTTAVALAVTAALRGARVVLVDLDPRAAATRWLDVHPEHEWQTVAAVLGNPDPDGWLEELALPCRWAQVPTLRVVPSARALANAERDPTIDPTRLSRALRGLAADVVVLDLPNRQGGPLTQNALHAAHRVVYPATLTEDGLDGVDGAALTVRRWTHEHPASDTAQLVETGAIASAVRPGVMSLDARRALAELTAREDGLRLLRPLVPDRVIVREARAAGAYFGFYPRGHAVQHAYTALTEEVLA